MLYLGATRDQSAPHYLVTFSLCRIACGGLLNAVPRRSDQRVNVLKQTLEVAGQDYRISIRQVGIVFLDISRHV